MQPLPEARLLCVDVDGTIKGPLKEDFSDKLKGAFRDFIDHGGQVAIISGRAPHQVREISDALGLVQANNDHNQPTYYGGNLGAAVGSTDGHGSSVALPPGFGPEIVHEALAKGMLVHIAREDHDYYDHMPPDEPQFKAYRGVLAPEVHEPTEAGLAKAADGANVIRIMNPDDSIAKIAARYPDVVMREDLSLGAPVALLQPSVDGKVADKGTAVQMIQAKTGISPKNTYSFGDLGTVDGPMAAHSHMVAVENADALLKGMAEFHCGPYHEDGVADFVNKLPTPALVGTLA